MNWDGLFLVFAFIALIALTIIWFLALCACGMGD